MEKMAADTATIITTVHRLKLTCIVQFIFLLIAVTEFAVYETENKPTMFADKLITGYWSDWSTGHVVPGLLKDSETARVVFKTLRRKVGGTETLRTITCTLACQWKLVGMYRLVNL